MIARTSTRIALSTVAGVLLVAGSISGVGATHNVAQAAAPAAGHSLVGAAQRPKFGKVLVNGRGFALYYWSAEKTGAVKCTGQCAKVWPPALVPAGTMVSRHVAGIMGTFGVVMRPDGSHQLSFDRHPLYTFQGDKTPSQILCDGVDGWHVLRLGH